MEVIRRQRREREERSVEQRRRPGGDRRRRVTDPSTMAPTTSSRHHHPDHHQQQQQWGRDDDNARAVGPLRALSSRLQRQKLNLKRQRGDNHLQHQQQQQARQVRRHSHNQLIVAPSTTTAITTANRELPPYNGTTNYCSPTSSNGAHHTSLHAPPDATLTPRADTWCYLLLSYCASVASLSIGTTPPSYRSTLQRLALASTGSGAVMTCCACLGMRYAPAREYITRSIGREDRLGSFAANVTLELILSVIVLFVSLLSAALIFSPNGDMALSGVEVWNANLYFATWTLSSLSTYLFADLVTTSNTRGVVSLETRYVMGNAIPRGWTLLLFATVSLLASSVALWTGSSCNGMAGNSRSCDMSIVGIVFGMLGVLLVWVYLLIAILDRKNELGSRYHPSLNRMSNLRGRGAPSLSRAPLSSTKPKKMIAGTVLSFVAFLFYCINVAFVTTPSPGMAAPANVYVSSWLCFGLSVYLCIRHVEVYLVPSSQRVPQELPQVNQSCQRGFEDKRFRRASSKTSRTSSSSTAQYSDDEEYQDADEVLTTMVESASEDGPMVFLPMNHTGNDIDDDDASYPSVTPSNNYHLPQYTRTRKPLSPEGHNGEITRTQIDPDDSEQPSFKKLDPAESESTTPRPRSSSRSPKSHHSTFSDYSRKTSRSSEKTEPPMNTPGAAAAKAKARRASIPLHADDRVVRREANERVSNLNEHALETSNRQSSTSSAYVVETVMSDVSDISASFYNNSMGDVVNPLDQATRSPPKSSRGYQGNVPPPPPPRREPSLRARQVPTKSGSPRQVHRESIDVIELIKEVMNDGGRSSSSSSGEPKSRSKSRSPSRNKDRSKSRELRSRRRKSGNSSGRYSKSPSRRSRSNSRGTKSKSTKSSSSEEPKSRSKSRSSSRNKDRSTSRDRSSSRRKSGNSSGRYSKSPSRRSSSSGVIGEGPPTMSASEGSSASIPRTDSEGSKSMAEEIKMGRVGPREVPPVVEEYTPQGFDTRPVKTIHGLHDEMSMVSEPTMDGFGAPQASSSFRGSSHAVVDGGDGGRETLRYSYNSPASSQPNENKALRQGAVDKMVMEALRQAHEARQMSHHTDSFPRRTLQGQERYSEPNLGGGLGTTLSPPPPPKAAKRQVYQRSETSRGSRAHSAGRSRHSHRSPHSPHLPYGSNSRSPHGTKKHLSFQAKTKGGSGSNGSGKDDSVQSFYSHSEAASFDAGDAFAC